MSNESGQNLEQSGEQKPKADNQISQPPNSVPPPVTVKSGPPPDAPHPPPSQNPPVNNPGPCKPEPPNWCDILTVILETLGIIGLAVYCGYTIAEWKTFDSERKTMEAESKSAQKNFIVDERAWLVADDFSDSFSENNESGIFTATFKNSGKTPALRVQVEIIFANQSNNIPAHDSPPAIPPSFGIIGPGQTTRINTTPIPAAVFALIAQGIPVYIYGTVWYDDIFREHHWSQFCVFANRTSMSKNMIEFTVCPFHNDCDDAEANQPK